jgi:putative ABC transport system substrate-binding protein
MSALGSVECGLRRGLRRSLILAVALSLPAAPFPADAQRAEGTVTVGYLGNSSPSLETNIIEALRERLRQRGYAEGRNLVLKFVWAGGAQEHLPARARELVRLAPDVIIAAGTPGTMAVKQATGSIPIVAVAGDFLQAGLVSSLANPGGNVTGLSALTAEMGGKWLELTKEALPKISRVAVFRNPSNPYTAIAWPGTQRGAQILGLTLQPVELKDPGELDAVLDRVKAAVPDAVVALPDRVLLANRKPIAQFMVKNRLPGMFPFREFAEEGGLMSYAPDWPAIYRRLAAYVVKIANGAKPDDLPVEQPTKFELVLNLKTGKAFDLTLPQSVLVRADEVIR